MLKIWCEKVHNLFQDFWGYFLKKFMVIAISFDKSRKLMICSKIQISHVFLTFHLNTVFTTDRDFLCSIYLHDSLKNISAKI